ncbi:MAG: PKD domain-containing protein [Lutimonas sp.]
MKNKLNIYRKTTLLILSIVVGGFMASCEDYFEFDLPEAGSKPDTALPSADFSYMPDANDYKTVLFTDLSIESTKYLWDFGGGVSSTQQDPSHTFPGEGVYPVTLTVSDANGASDSKTVDVIVEDLFVPLTPEILNGDFEQGSADWSISSFTGGTTSPFNTSSDGSWLKYDGTDNGSKTRGAKWTKSTSAGAYLSSDTRYAYQAIVVSPNVDYILEYEYAIKTPDEQSGEAPDGNRIIGEILDGHFSDGADAVASTPLVTYVGSEVKGKVIFTTVKIPFTSNSTGEVAIWISAVTDVDAYVDNVKVYPAE